jgi:hypothetical protein
LCYALCWLEAGAQVTAGGVNKSQADPVKNRIDSIARSDSPKMLFEIAAGPGVCTTWRDQYYQDQIPFWRYAIGLGVNRSIGPRLEIGTKLLWEAKGSRMQHVYPLYFPQQSDYVQGTRMNYITLAVMVQCFMDRKHRTYGGLGVSGGWLTHDENYTYFYDINGKLTDYYQSGIYDTFVNFEAGLIATAGYRLRLAGSLFLNFQVIGNLGVTDIEVDFEPLNTYPLSNANLMLLIGIGIPGTRGRG